MFQTSKPSNTPDDPEDCGIEETETSSEELSDAYDLNGFWQRESKRVARNPCRYLWISLLTAIALSFVALVVGEFEVSAETGGWQSRGTMIADRQTQLLLADFNQEYLFYGGDEAWEDLLTNVQPGWEEDYYEDDNERRRTSKSLPIHHKAESMVELLRPNADLLQLGHAEKRRLPFKMTEAMTRRLQESVLPDGCDTSWYTPGNMTETERLWPMWRMKKETNSALDADIIRDICVAEQNTQAHLEEKGLCFGCQSGGQCLPPYSIVLFARLTVPDGMGLSCEELKEAWLPYEEPMAQEWKTCVEDIKATYSKDNDELPESCPPWFYPTLVDENFDETLISTYTSSIFATEWYHVDDLYEEVGNFDRGSNLVEGAYDTQYEDFVNIYLDASLTSDMALALGSAVVVAIAIVLHTRSPFITLIGLLQIILSFPLSYFVYKLIAGLNFFPFLNFIGVFVVFALGAGDVFVAVDKWKNARMDHPSKSTEYIAAVAFPDAASAMFLTTLTTAVAFFATAICPVAPIKMFAIFCGLLIIFDYIMNILLVFPALCIYDKALQARGPDNVNCCITCGCFGLFKNKSTEDDNTDNDDDNNATGKTQASKAADEEEFEMNFIRRILVVYYNVLHRIRWPLFLVCVGAFITTAYFASTLEMPTSSDVRLLDESVQFEQSYLWRRNLLSEALEKADGSQAYVIWGVRPADTGDQNDPAKFSQLVLDNSFDPSSQEAQVFMADFCDNLFDQDFASEIETDYVCPVQQFASWLEVQSATNSSEQDQIYLENCNGASGLPVPTEHFNPCMIAWSKQVHETSILSHEDKVQIIFFPFSSRVRYDDHYDTLDEEWNLIEDWMDQQNRDAPEGVTRGYFSSFDFWWYDTNGQMLQTAYSAAGIALGCAAAVILFSSRSLLLTLFSTATIGYVLTSVTATLVAMGWTLGFLESICFAILIGVSVDFVIHFSHAYTVLQGTVDRNRRTKYALIKMGPSILATAVTTILSAVVMLFTVITFFQKFALILFFTIIQATAGSFIVFLTTVDCVGPSNPTYLVDKYILRKSETDESEMEPTSRDVESS